MKVFCTALLLSLTFWSCQKEIEFKEPNFDLITRKPWVINKLYYGEQGDNQIFDVTDLYFKDCEKDDGFYFNKDLSFTRRDSTNTCDVLVSLYGPFGSTGWGLDSLQKSLSVAIPFVYNYTFEVTYVSSKEFILTHNTVDYAQKKVFFIYDFKPGR